MAGSRVVLVVRQPWAWAIFHAGRDMENRDWTTRFRGRVAIHAPLEVDSAAVDWLVDWFGITVPTHLPVGQTVGSVRITDCVSDSRSPWFRGPYGLVLDDPRPYAVAIHEPDLDVCAWQQLSEVSHA